MNNLIVTCGTSIITNSRNIKDEVLKNKKYEDITEDDKKNLEEKIYNRICNFESEARDCGAEINSISMLLKKDKFSGEKIHLIISDSIEGIIAGNLIKRYVSEKIGISKVEIDKIAYLNIGKEFEFAKKGLKNLSLKIASIIEKYNKDIALCPIGGFKAQIFIAGLIAQIYKVKAYYLYEGSPNIVELLPLPITLDSGILLRNIEIVSELRNEEILEKIEVEPYLKKDPELKIFFEDEHIDGENYYSLSVLGALAYDKLALELKSSLPEPSKKNPRDKKYITKKDESHCEAVSETPEFKNFINSILEVSFVEQVILNFYTPDSKGKQKFFSKSSNLTEGRVIKFTYNHKKGMVGGNIFLTESDDEDKIDSALIYLKENI
ncbi:MAG: hypothetical protein ACRCZ9_04600 [Fusobacteriaceae bacterium]